MANHWYPRDDIAKQALIDQYLESHHSGLRKGGEFLFFQLFLPKLVGEENAKKIATPAYLGYQESFFNKSLDVIEEVWLARAETEGQSNYLTGVSEMPTIADISAACELIQFKFMPEKYEEIMGERPRIKRWMERMMNFPEMKEAHEFFEHGVAKFLSRKKPGPKL